MDESRKRSLIAEGLLFVLAMIWGGTFVAGKFALEAMDPYWILVIRFYIGASVLVAIFWKDFRAINAYTLKAGIEIGLLLVVGTAFQLIGLQYTTPAQQSFIIVTYVVTVPLLSWIVYKKYPGNLILIAALITMVGVGFLSLNKSFTINKGDVLTGIYALLFAVQMLRVGRHAPKVSSSVGFTIVQLYTCAVVSSFLAIFMAGPVFTKPPTLSLWLGLGYLTFLNTSAAYVIQNYSQKFARPEKSALIISTESLFGALAAYFIAGEVFTSQKILGCVLVFCGISLAQLGPIFIEKHKNRKKHIHPGVYKS